MLIKSRTNSSRRRRYQRTLRYMEALEPRTLLSATVTATAYSVPGLAASGGAYDSGGNLWIFNTSSFSLDKIVNGAIDDSIILLDSNTNDPLNPIGSVVAGVGPSAGHMFLGDLNGGMDDVNLSAGTATYYPFAADLAHTPQYLAVTGNGDVWFTGAALSGSNVEIGRWVPGAGSADYVEIPVVDASPFDIASAGSDSVWVALPQNDGGGPGINSIAYLSFSGGFSGSVYPVVTTDPTADANNFATSVVSDGAGGVWFTLANSPGSTIPGTTDSIVHGVISGPSLVQNIIPVDGATPGNPLLIGNLALDTVNNRLWFDELNGTNVDYFDTGTATFTPTPYPAGTTTAGDLLLDSGSGDVTIINFTNDSTLISVTVEESVTFGGVAYNISGPENSAFHNIHLADFVAPAPLGTYTATINWGNGNITSGVAVTSLGNDTYSLTVSSVTFPTQGVFNGTVSIIDSGNNSTAGVLPFTSTISDTPLVVTSYSVNNVIGRIVLATVVFTDDVDSTASWFNVNINWGDNSSSAGLVVKDPTTPGRYLVLGLHLYSRRGTYTVKTTVTSHDEMSLVTSVTVQKNISVS